MRGQLDDAIAQGDRQSALNELRRLYDRPRFACAEHFLEACLIVLAALRQRGRQVRVPDKRRLIVEERAGTEDVIGMHVRQEHEAYRAVRDAADATAQLRAVRETAARIDHRDGIAADDEANVRNGIEIVRRSNFLSPAAHVNARGDLFNLERFRSHRAEEPRRTAETQASDECVATSAEPW